MTDADLSGKLDFEAVRKEFETLRGDTHGFPLLQALITTPDDRQSALCLSDRAAELGLPILETLLKNELFRCIRRSWSKTDYIDDGGRLHYYTFSNVLCMSWITIHPRWIVMRFEAETFGSYLRPPSDEWFPLLVGIEQ